MEKIIGPRGARALKRWNPKEWKPEYEAVVALSATGMSREEILKRLGLNYTTQWVTNILNSDQAKIVQQMIVAKTRESALNSIPARLEALKEIAVKRVEDTLKNDKLAERSPMAIFDRSLAFLKSGGTIGSDDAPRRGDITTNNTLIITSNEKNDLRKSLEVAENVKSLHG